MNIAFAGFRHSHILGLYNSIKDHQEFNLVGCFEENNEARKKMEESNQIQFNFQTYDEILGDSKIDVIAIGDYYGKRGKMVIEALKHGKHIICDKPICTDLSELDEIEALAAEKNLQVMCMLDLRYLSQAHKVRDMIYAGEIGDVHIVSFTGQHCLDYGNRPSWYFEEGKHGGTINDIAIHGVDLVRFLTGKNLTKVNCAKTWNAFADKEPAFKDCGQFMIEMENISVMADVSYAAPKYSEIPTYWDFYIWGSKGMIHFGLRDSQIHLYKETETLIDCTPFVKEFPNDFLKEVKGIPTHMNTQEILKSQRQVLMVQRYADGEVE